MIELRVGRTTVRRAYLIPEAGAGQRVIVNNRGHVYEPASGWVAPVGQVVPVGDSYERWSDVPSAWVGFSPWFR